MRSPSSSVVMDAVFLYSGNVMVMKTVQTAVMKVLVSRRHVLNLTLCVTVVSVCRTDGSVMGIRTVRMGLTRVLNCAI